MSTASWSARGPALVTIRLTGPADAVTFGEDLLAEEVGRRG